MSSSLRCLRASLTRFVSIKIVAQVSINFHVVTWDIGSMVLEADAFSLGGKPPPALSSTIANYA